MDALDITGCINLLHIRRLGHQGAIWLGDALHHNVDLQNLDLHHTEIGDDDAVSLANGLRNNTHLKKLHLHNNRIFDVGTTALADALLENSALEFLALSSNGVGDEGAKALARALRGNTGLRRLDLYFNMVGDEGTTAIAEALAVNRGLRTLHIDTNRVGEDGGLALARAIKGTPGGLLGGQSVPQSVLGELTLTYNQLSNVAIDTFIGAAKKNPFIHKLTIDHNHMVHGVSKDDLQNILEPMMAERLELATWLVEAGLVVGGWNSPDGPPLMSDLANPVRELKAHTSAGLRELRGMAADAMEAHPALASLTPERRAVLLATLRKKISELPPEHDEL